MQPRHAISLSIAVAVVVFLLKAWAWKVTGSAALFSDALESIVNIVAACAAAWALRIASIPPDRNHPYGHSKAEYLSAVLEGVLIVVAAGLIVREATLRLFDPQEPEALGFGLLLSSSAAALNGALGWILLRAAARSRSTALRADGLHVLADVGTSAGVLIGLILARATGMWILDPILALLVAGHILWVGSRLVRDSMGGLMDEGLPEQELKALKAELDSGAASDSEGMQIVEIHGLRTRRAGNYTWVEFHLVVSGQATVERAHRLCDALEERVEKLLPGSIVSIHVEPEWKAERSV